MRETHADLLSGLRRSRITWLALSSLTAVCLSLFVLVGESNAQDDVPPFW
jgi:hypothetical protein